MKKKNGFTLIELLIVIIIIGILASFGIPKYFQLAERGRSTEAVHLLGALRASQLRYQNLYNAYAAGLGSLDVNNTTLKYWTVTLQSSGEVIRANRTATGGGNTVWALECNVTSGAWTNLGSYPYKPED